MKELEEYGVQLPAGCTVVEGGKPRVATESVVSLAKTTGWRFEVIGLPIGRKNGEFKPASCLLRAFPAKKKIVGVTRAEAEEFLRGADLKAEEWGYVAVKCGALTLGCGFVKHGVLENKIPKGDLIKA